MGQVSWVDSLRVTKQLFKLFNGQVQDTAGLEVFDELGFLDSKPLSSFSVVSVVIRGFVVDGSAGGEMEHGFSGSVFRWVILTFPRYQCNESRIFVRKDRGSLSVREIMYSDVIVELYIHVGSRLGRRDDAISIYSLYNDMCLSI